VAFGRVRKTLDMTNDSEVRIVAGTPRAYEHTVNMADGNLFS